MRILAAIFISLCIVGSMSIDQNCTVDSACGPNGFCSSGHCKCNIGYILDCTVPAQTMTDAFQDFEITNVTSYYQTPNQSPNIYYSFLFQVCCDNTNLTNYNLNFSLWANDGQPFLNSDNFVGTVSISLEQLVQAQRCIDFVQYQIKLDTQPNGETENLIVGMVIEPKSQSDQVDYASVIIKSNVTIKEIVSSQMLIKLAIGIICFAAVAVAFIVAFFCYKRYKAAQVQKQKMNYKQRMVEQFKKITPECQARTLSIPTMSTCSICLGQFEPSQLVRRVVCRHIFHSECIDGWCMKNLSCPVCRMQLDQETIRKKQKQIQMTNIKWRDNALSERQELNETLNR